MSTPLAKSYHSVNFSDGEHIINTWDDWKLIPSSRPLIVPPSVIQQTEDLEATEGEVDTTSYLLGSRPHLGLAEGDISFIMVNLDKDYYDRIWWSVRRSQIMEFLHGQRRRIILDDEPDYYYEGRFAVSFATGKDYSTVVVKYKIDIYRKQVS